MGAIRRDAMQLLAVTVVLIVVLARIEGTQAKRTVPEVIRVELMQYHHEKSPYATPNLSLGDRVKIAVKSSRERARLFNAKISKSRYSNIKASADGVFSNQGDYLMKVSVGTPPQTKAAIMDTGSDLFWLQCHCISCFAAPDSAFDPTKSSTFSAVSCGDTLCTDLPSSGCTTVNSECEYYYSYGDQSTTQGILSLDVLSLGSSSNAVHFGCGENNQGTFTNTDGLIGFGRGPDSVVSQIGFGAFSYCLTSFYSSTSKTSSLVLGDAGGSYSFTPLVFNAANPTFYYVNLIGMLVDGTPLSIPSGTFSIDSFGNGGFILDSGTTITQLQMAAYTPLLAKVQSLITYTPVDGSSVGLDACYNLGTSSPTWPTVTFQFQGVDVVLPGDNLFLLMDNQGSYCMAIQGTSFGFGIYGNVQQQNFNIKYNLAGKTVGFSGSTSC